MLKEQIQKYENIRQLFFNPDKVVVSNKEERKAGSPFFSLNFPIELNLSMKVRDIIGELAKEDPGHEYIPASMLHCTVKSFGLIGEQINEKLIPRITKQVETMLKNFPSFEVELKGINTLRVAAFIQVFSKDDKLFELHNLLNTAIPYSKYPKLEGRGYVPHIAIVYFYHKPAKLFSALNKYKDIPIGKMEVERFDLIRGWPQRRVKREIIKSFQLK